MKKVNPSIFLLLLPCIFTFTEATFPDTPCTEVTGQVDCATDLTDLYCNTTSLTCQCPGIQYFDYIDTKCYKQSGSYCSGAFDNCSPNTHCVWNVCACSSVDFQVTPTGKCVKSIGKNCTTSEAECDREAFLICRSGNDEIDMGTCQCNGTKVEDALYDPIKGQCILQVHSECQDFPWSQPCQDASCTNGTCQCDPPATVNWHGVCRVALGQPCQVNADCDEYNFLVCNSNTGECECDKSQGLVVNDKGMCVRAGMDGCGGLLEGDGGDFDFPVDSKILPGALCLWVLKISKGNGFNFTLSGMGSGTTLVLYPEHASTDTQLEPLRLTSDNVGDTVQMKGQTLTVILKQNGDVPSSGFSFNWESTNEGREGGNLLVEGNYFDTKEGKVGWHKLGVREGVTVGLNFPMGYKVSVGAVTNFESCELADPCLCTYFALYEVLPENGELREVTKVCGHSSEFKFVKLQPQLVAFIQIGNSTQNLDGRNRIGLSWSASV